MPGGTCQDCALSQPFAEIGMKFGNMLAAVSRPSAGTRSAKPIKMSVNPPFMRAQVGSQEMKL